MPASPAIVGAVGREWEHTPAMYASRVLPPEEWPRLNGTELEALWPKLDPGRARVVVVERDGAIVGAWGLVPIVHVEGAWIAPECRGRAGVARRLYAAMQAAARAMGAPFVWTGAESDGVRRLIAHVNGYRIPYESYVMPVEGE